MCICTPLSRTLSPTLRPHHHRNRVSTVDTDDENKPLREDWLFTPYGERLHKGHRPTLTAVPVSMQPPRPVHPRKLGAQLTFGTKLGIPTWRTEPACSPYNVDSSRRHLPNEQLQFRSYGFSVWPKIFSAHISKTAVLTLPHIREIRPSQAEVKPVHPR